MGGGWSLGRRQRDGGCSDQEREHCISSRNDPKVVERHAELHDAEELLKRDPATLGLSGRFGERIGMAWRSTACAASTEPVPPPTSTAVLNRRVAEVQPTAVATAQVAMVATTTVGMTWPLRRPTRARGAECDSADPD